MKKYLVLAVSVLVLLSFGICEFYAQNPSTEKESDEKDKREKQELEKFYSEFAGSFEAHRDFNKMPAELFAPDFKSILARNDESIKNVLSLSFNNHLNQ